ncbi:MAG TPA: IgGFc-binding protein, partial [Candidatus Kapabacteria bacterium]|nr:IgGFc-binding protein [Candidatus Kapabacteria bacterium]
MKIAGISLLLVLWLAGGSVAQVGQRGLNADGKDFYLGWLYPSYNDQNLNLGTRDPKPFFGVYVLVASYTDNQFTVSYFDDKTGKEVVASSYKIAKRRALIVPVDRTKMRMDGNNFDGEVAQWRAMHITSKKPINVQFFSSGANSGGSYLSLPVSALGKEYVVEAYKDNPSGAGGYLSSENASGYFMVIAAFDGTKVTITPNSTTKVLHHPGVNCGDSSGGEVHPYTITLQRGQCYMVKSQGLDSYCNISGTTVVADRPVAVIGGHENAFTEGSDVGTILVEQRDYMVEQMIPVEYWDSTGYFTVPMVDSKNAQGGDGDNVAMFYGKLQNAPANYPDHTTVTLSSPAAISYSVYPYPAAMVLKTGITTATSAYDNNGAKMHVVQYDQRMQGGAPYPAPSQLSIIPKSCWKSSYLWYVPSNVTPQEVYQGYYITLICDKDDYNNGTLQWAQDGGPLVPIKTAGTVGGLKNFGAIAPNLIGMAIKLNSPRAYYATSTIKKPFIVYNYGFRAIDADRDLGDFCSDDHFFGYATPVGFAANTGDSSFFTVTIDTLCAKWDVCAKVTGSNSPKIKSISLLNDPDGDLVTKVGSTAGYVSYNVRFDPKDDPDGKGEINFSDTLSTKCVRLFVQNPLDSGYAAVLIVDDKGNYVVKELNYKASAIADTIKGLDFDLTKSPWGLVNASLGYHKDSIVYPITEIGDSHCATIFYFNSGDSLKGTAPVIVTGAKLGGADGSFTMTTSAVKFPVTLHPKGAGPADT